MAYKMALSLNASPAERLAALSPELRAEAMRGLTEAQSRSILWDWDGFWARGNQVWPADRTDANIWMILAGRGFGKTKSLAQQVRRWEREGYRRIHLVGSTAADVRDVMIQGESGILSCYQNDSRPLYEPSKRLISWPSGCVAIAFSAEEPERLRGPQCECFAADELASWQRGQETWDNLQFGWRLGDNPKGIIATTPKPLKLLKEIIADPHTVTTRASSYENRGNLAAAFFDSIIRKYEGTRLGRQELLAEILEDVPGALWNREMIERARVTTYPNPLARIVVAIDPAVSAGEDSSENGIIVVGLDWNGHCYVLEDVSLRGSPREWALVVIAAYRRWKADLIVGEVNNGGDLVESNVRSIDPSVPFRQVRASRGKLIRAEPVANLYEQKRVHHYNCFPELEDQLCNYTPNSDMASPDRLDSLCWGITELLIDIDQTPSVHPVGQRVQISRY